VIIPWSLWSIARIRREEWLDLEVPREPETLPEA
jgi:hypothetical protein